jgi:hypothetical protein
MNHSACPGKVPSLGGSRSSEGLGLAVGPSRRPALPRERWALPQLLRAGRGRGREPAREQRWRESRPERSAKKPGLLAQPAPAGRPWVRHRLGGVVAASPQGRAVQPKWETGCCPGLTCFRRRGYKLDPDAGLRAVQGWTFRLRFSCRKYGSARVAAYGKPWGPCEAWDCIGCSATGAREKRLL